MTKVDNQMALKRLGRKFQKQVLEENRANVEKLARYGWSKKHIASYFGVEVALVSDFLGKKSIDIIPVFIDN